MQDLEILLENKPGSLARLGETLGKNQISLEGGGVFVNGEQAIAHFLVADGIKAKYLLKEAGFKGIKVNVVLIQKLRQDIPGQLGMICRRMAEAGVNILTQYSDHSNRLILVVDNMEAGKKVSEAWMREWWQEPIG